MSVQLINHSPDLKRLMDEGYNLSIKNGILVIKDIPYVNNNKEVCTGILVSKLTLSGQKAVYNQDHVVHFTGETPCHKDGRIMNEILHQQRTENHGNNIITQMSFSSKPTSGYKDYFHKMVTYINILQSPAQSISPNATAKKFRVILSEGDNSIFEYFDTYSSRASINNISTKLEKYKIGIIGLGGTGSYILDFVSKTPVSEIHLFDGDKFYSHNAFRAPGAASKNELFEESSKVKYFKTKYSQMHKKIYEHELFLDESNLNLLKELNYVFIALDNGTAKKVVFDFLEQQNIPYTDVGLGISINEDKLLGMIRTSSFNPNSKKILKTNIDFENNEDNAYQSNIQIAELNALNAILAVINWKKHAGFYQTTVSSDETLFMVDTLKLLRIQNDAA